MNQGMLSDAIATTTGAICATSTGATFCKVNAGVTSVFSGAFFFVAMFLSPISQLVSVCATAAALRRSREARG